MSRVGLTIAVLVFVARAEWINVGPTPIFKSDSGGENIEPKVFSGGVQSLVTHPSNPDIMWAATVNGGVWKTADATSSLPHWFPVTDSLPSLSIGALSLDPTDASSNTLIAGVAAYSTFELAGGAPAGVYRSVDGGMGWTWLSAFSSSTRKFVSAVAARGQVLLAAAAHWGLFRSRATVTSAETVGLFRSTNGGTSWTPVPPQNGLPPGPVLALAGDPLHPTHFYCALLSPATTRADTGIYKSTDTGATWTKVTTAAVDSVMFASLLPVTVKVVVSVGASSSVFVLVVNSDGVSADDAYIFRSPDGGATWTQLDTPRTADDGHPGLFVGPVGNVFGSLIADPKNPFVCYVSGDIQQPLNGMFPNSIGALKKSGRHFRIDASLPSPQFVPITHQSQQRCRTTGSQTQVPAGTACAMQYSVAGSPAVLSGCTTYLYGQSWCAIGASYAGPFSSSEFTWAHCDPASCELTGNPAGTISGTSPHPSARCYAFDARGDLVSGGEGGVERRSSPQFSNGDWFSASGDLSVVELTSLAHDADADILLAGAQGNGVVQQVNSGARMWVEISDAGTGADVDVDVTTSVSFRYSSTTAFAEFRRMLFDPGNLFLGPANARDPYLPHSTEPIHPFQTGSDWDDVPWGNVGEPPLTFTKTSFVAAQVEARAPTFVVNRVDGKFVVFAVDVLYESQDYGSTVVPILDPVVASIVRPVYGATFNGTAYARYLAAADADRVFVRPSVRDMDWHVFSAPCSFAAISIDDMLNLWGVCRASTPEQPVYVASKLYDPELDAYPHPWTGHRSNLFSVVPPSIGVSQTWFVEDYLRLYDVVWAESILYVATTYGVYEYHLEDDFWRRSSGNVGTAGALPPVVVVALEWEPVTSTLYAATLGRGAFVMRNTQWPVGAPADVSLGMPGCTSYAGLLSWSPPESSDDVAIYEVWAGLSPTIEVRKLASTASAATSLTLPPTSVKQSMLAGPNGASMVLVDAPYLLVYPIRSDSTRVGTPATVLAGCVALPSATASPSYSASASASPATLSSSPSAVSRSAPPSLTGSRSVSRTMSKSRTPSGSSSWSTTPSNTRSESLSPSISPESLTPTHSRTPTRSMSVTAAPSESATESLSQTVSPTVSLASHSPSSSAPASKSPAAAAAVAQPPLQNGMTKTAIPLAIAVGVIVFLVCSIGWGCYCYRKRKARGLRLNDSRAKREEKKKSKGKKGKKRIRGPAERHCPESEDLDMSSCTSQSDDQRKGRGGRSASGAGPKSASSHTSKSEDGANPFFDARRTAPGDPKGASVTPVDAAAGKRGAVVEPAGSDGATPAKRGAAVAPAALDTSSGKRGGAVAPAADAAPAGLTAGHGSGALGTGAAGLGATAPGASIAPPPVGTRRRSLAPADQASLLAAPAPLVPPPAGSRAAASAGAPSPGALLPPKPRAAPALGDGAESQAASTSGAPAAGPKSVSLIGL